MAVQLHNPDAEDEIGGDVEYGDGGMAAADLVIDGIRPVDSDAPIGSEEPPVRESKRKRGIRQATQEAVAKVTQKNKAEAKASGKKAKKEVDPTIIPGTNRKKIFNITSFEEGVERGKLMATDIDNQFWKLGDLIAEIPTQFGKKTVEVFAAQVGIAKATCTSAAWMAKVWSPKDRDEITSEMPFVTRSHIKEVTKLAARGKTGRDDAMMWLVRANDGDGQGNAWSVEMLKRAMNPASDDEKKRNITVPHVTITGFAPYEDEQGNSGTVMSVFISGQAADEWAKSFEDAGFLNRELKASFTMVNTD